MATVYLWGGASTPSTFWVRAKMTGASARLVVSTAPSFPTAIYFGPAAPTGDGIVSITATGLNPNTTYYYALEIDGSVDSDTTGRIRTHPPAGVDVDFTLAAFSCAGLEPRTPGIGNVLAPGRSSNTPTYATVVDLHDPLQVVHLGDADYYDLGSDRHGITGGASVANFRRSFDDQFAQPNQSYMHRMAAVQRERDDHDGGPNNHDRTFESVPAYLSVYRERVPHYPLTVPGNDFQAWRIGPAQCVLWDVRSHRDPNTFPDTDTKTMLGPAQRFAFEQVLANSSADVLVIFSPSAWHSTSEDSWATFTREQQWVIKVLADHGWKGRTFIVQGDIHAVALDTGTSTPGNIPVLQAAAMDSWSGGESSRWDTGPSEPGGNQYGTVRVQSFDDRVEVTLAGWRDAELRRSHTFTVATDVDEPPPTTVPTPPPGSEATPRTEVTWLACDLVTGDVIAYLPMLSGTITRALGAYTQDTLTLPIPLSGPGSLGPLAWQSTEMARTMIVAVVNDKPAWAGTVLKPVGGTAETLSLAVISLEGYLARRYVRDHEWAQRDEAAVIAAGLVGDAQIEGIGLTIDAPATGTLRDRQYHDTDDATVYDRLTELMNVEDGPEWTIDIDWRDPKRKTSVEKIFRCYKRLGTAEPSAVFSTRGATQARYTWTEDYSHSNGANDIMATSSGEGDDRPQSVHIRAETLIASGMPRYEYRWSPSSSIKDRGTLNQHAAARLRQIANGTTSIEIEARWDREPARWGVDWNLGDSIAFDLVGGRHPAGLRGTARAVGWRLDTGKGVITPTLRL